MVFGLCKPAHLPHVNDRVMGRRSASSHHQGNHICRLIPSSWLPSGTSKICFHHMGTAVSFGYNLAQEVCLITSIITLPIGYGASLVFDNTLLVFTVFFRQAPRREQCLVIQIGVTQDCPCELRSLQYPLFNPTISHKLQARRYSFTLVLNSHTIPQYRTHAT